MPDPTSYTPVYVNEGEIPTEGPDPYSKDEKRAALYRAEPEFEHDVADGEPIPNSKVNDMHRSAVSYLGTYYLVRSARSPDDATLGDMADPGQSRNSYADSMLEDYQRLIDKIRNVGSDGAETGYGSNVSIAVNNRDSTGMSQEYPYDQSDRYP